MYAFSNNIFTFSKTSTPNSTNTTKPSNFELFTDSGQSTLTNNQKIISIRLIDTTKEGISAQNIKDKLLEKGYLIEKTLTSETTLESSEILYQKEFFSNAEKIKIQIEELKNAKIAADEAVDKSYDILIKIGQNTP